MPVPELFGAVLRRGGGERLFYSLDGDELVGWAFRRDGFVARDRINIITTNFRASDSQLEAMGLNGRFVLRAATADAAARWAETIARQKEGLLEGTATRPASHAVVSALLLRDGNDRCAECGAAYPQWVSVNLGCVFCIQCSGVHRSLGVAVSKVRSTTLDHLEDHVLRVLAALGNERVNRIFQPKPALTETATAQERTYVIRRKYVDRLFVAPRAEDWNALALRAAERGDVEALLDVVAHCPLAELTQRGLLIAATQCRSCACVGFLLLNGYAPNEQDERGNTALHLSAQANLVDIALALIRCHCDTRAVNAEGETAGDIAACMGNGFISSMIRYVELNDTDQLAVVTQVVETALQEDFMRELCKE